MKKVISILLVIALLATLLPSYLIVSAEVASDNNCQIEIGSVSGKAGDEVSVDVCIKNDPGIIGASLSVNYAEGLTLVDSEKGDAFNGLTFVKPGRYKNGCVFTWDAESIDPNDIVSEGVIMTLVFAISETAQSGNILPISISYNEGDIFDSDFDFINPAVVSGSIIVVSYTPGDVNDDGKINTMDVVLIRRFIADGCTTDPDGYNVSIIEEAADVNDDGRINTMDVVYIRRYIADGCTTDPEGYNIVLKPSTKTCNHNLQKHEAHEATCLEDGNIEYWNCTKCGKFFSDAEAKHEITQDSTVIHATGHSFSDEWMSDQTYHWHVATCEHSSMVSGREEHVFDDSNTCVVCGYVKYVEPETFSITYNLFDYADNDMSAMDYLMTQQIDNSANPSAFSASDSFNLAAVNCPGFTFNGWFTIDKVQVTRIDSSVTHDIVLYASWTENTYHITYNLYGTPVEEIDSKYKDYKVSTGLAEDLPNPVLKNYVFLGWYNEDGQEVTKILPGTVGNIVLNPYFTSRRNLAKKSSASTPIVINNIDDGIIYFAYELGTIENVPLSNPIWQIESVAGLDQQVSESRQVTVSNEVAHSAASSITKATVDSGTWSLSNQWTDITEVSEEWAAENGMTQEEAKESIKTQSDTISINTSNGGKSTSTKTDGTTVLAYDSREDSYGNTFKADAKLNIEFKPEVSVSVLGNGGGLGGVGWEADIGLGYQHDTNHKTHTGTDTTSVHTSVAESSSSWNNSNTSTNTVGASNSELMKNTLSSVIANTKGYGRSYAVGGEQSGTIDYSSSLSSNENSSSSVTYFTSSVEVRSETYHANENIEGKYRLILAGTYHVFGVVGYDVASKSFFSYTYSVLDDDTHLFLDYSPLDADFDDCEYSVLPFEVPYFVYEYVSDSTASTNGLVYRTNTTDKTATVVSYSGANSEVAIPAFISAGNTAYKVVGFSANAFTGKGIEKIIIGKYIEEIPAGAFKNCSNLKEVYGHFDIIGEEAFSGCSALNNFAIPDSVTEIGLNAFLGVPNVKATIISAESAMYDKMLTANILNEVVACGANIISADLTYVVNDFEFNINPENVDVFELKGGRRAFLNSSIYSSANETILRDITLDNRTGIPLKISSETVTLEAVDVTSQNYSLILTSPGVQVNLVRDSKITSLNSKAIVCKNPTFTSEIIDNAIGVLEVAGNIYVCGNITGVENIDQLSGNIITISDAEFSQYINGACTVTFDANGGIVSTSTMEAFYGFEYGTLPTATRTGYTFDGWYTARTGGTKVMATTLVENGNDHTLYAHWIANTYTVTFNANGGSVSTTTATVAYDSAYGSLPSPSRTGYTFAGWYTSQTGGSKVETTTIVQTANDHTLFARWTANTYTVVFNANGGSGTMQNQTFTYDVAKNLTSNNFTRTNCVFLGWSTYSSATTATYANGQSVNNLAASGTVTLYAVWERVTFNVTSATLTREPSGVTINKTSLTLATVATGDYATTGALTASVSGYSSPTKTVVATVSNGASVTWTSSNTSVATVSSSGVITAKGNGSAVITATTANGAKATCNVTVSTSSGTITWSSNNTAVATVSSGTVTAVQKGSATITASTSNNKKATCAVTVGETYKAIALESTSAYATTDYKASSGSYYNGRGLYIWSSSSDCSVTMTFVTGNTIPDGGCLYQIASPSTDMKNTYQIHFSSGKIAVTQGQHGKTATAVSNYTLSPNTKYTVVVTMNKYVSTPTSGSIVIKDENGSVLDTTQCTYSTHSGSNGASSAAIGPKSSILNGVAPNVKMLYMKIVGTQGSSGYAVETFEFNCANLDAGTATIVNGNIRANFVGTSVQTYVLF